MTLEDTLHDALHQFPPQAPLAPEQVRHRARGLRRRRGLSLAGGSAGLAALILTGSVLTSQHTPPPGGFAGAGSSATVQPSRPVPLATGGRSAYSNHVGICWDFHGATFNRTTCVPVAKNIGPVNLSWDAADGLVCAVVKANVVDGTFSTGKKTVPAHIVRFSRYPNWVLLAAHLPYSTRGRVTVHGWNTAGKLVLNNNNADRLGASPSGKLSRTQ